MPYATNTYSYMQDLAYILESWKVEAPHNLGIQATKMCVSQCHATRYLQPKADYIRPDTADSVVCQIIALQMVQYRMLSCLVLGRYIPREQTRNEGSSVCVCVCVCVFVCLFD